VAELMRLNFWNGLLPLGVLVLLTIGLPALLAGTTLSQGRLAVVMVVTGLVVWGVGAGLMAVLYGSVNDGVTRGLWFYVERSSLMALLWGPILALVWLMRAQGVERRRGLLMKGAP
jgi:hypothetical protein